MYNIKYNTAKKIARQKYDLSLIFISKIYWVRDIHQIKDMCDVFSDAQTNANRQKQYIYYIENMYD